MFKEIISKNKNLVQIGNSIRGGGGNSFRKIKNVLLLEYIFCLPIFAFAGSIQIMIHTRSTC